MTLSVVLSSMGDSKAANAARDGLFELLWHNAELWVYLPTGAVPLSSAVGFATLAGPNIWGSVARFAGQTKLWSYQSCTYSVPEKRFEIAARVGKDWSSRQTVNVWAYRAGCANICTLTQGSLLDGFYLADK